MAQVALLKAHLFESGKAKTSQLRITIVEAHILHMCFHGVPPYQLTGSKFNPMRDQLLPGGIGQVTRREARILAAHPPHAAVGPAPLFTMHAGKAELCRVLISEIGFLQQYRGKLGEILERDVISHKRRKAFGQTRCLGQIQ
mgnify:CR=1 FL=1